VRRFFQLETTVSTGVYVVLSFARLKVPEGKVEELPDETWLVMTDKPAIFAGEGRRLAPTTFGKTPSSLTLR